MLRGERVIQLVDHAEGIVLPVRAQPRARRTGIVGEQGGALKVAVAAPPEDGKANAALIEVLADALAVRRSQIELLSGSTARDKKFLILGTARASLEGRLKELIEQT